MDACGICVHKQKVVDTGPTRVLESVWIVPEAASAAVIRDDLRRYIDANDSLFVAGMTGETAWATVKAGSDQTLKRIFQSAA
jgi:hypothetical protein